MHLDVKYIHFIHSFNRFTNYAAITCSNLLIPKTKQMESRIFDFPVPLSPVIAVNSESKSLISVRFP